MFVHCNYMSIFVCLCLICSGYGQTGLSGQTKIMDICILYIYRMLVIIISNLRATEKSSETETMTETEQQHSTGEANDEFQPVTQWDRENWSVASSARVFTFFILSRSLSQEMFVHNSGARNVIHLFALWCGVLQNIDERQSVAMCVHVRACPKLWMNEVEKSHFKNGRD